MYVPLHTRTAVPAIRKSKTRKLQGWAFVSAVCANGRDVSQAIVCVSEPINQSVPILKKITTILSHSRGRFVRYSYDELRPALSRQLQVSQPTRINQSANQKQHVDRSRFG